MNSTYTTIEPTELDALAAAVYGITNADAGLRLIYDANPRLSNFGVSLPEGLTIFLPTLPPSDGLKVRLWD